MLVKAQKRKMGLFNKYFKEIKKQNQNYSAFVSLRFNSFNENLKRKKVKEIMEKLFDFLRVLGGDTYLSDSLFVWGRELGWIRDNKFLNSCEETSLSTETNIVNSSISWRTHIACWAASHACNAKGDFFEFGCHAGYTACMIRNFVEDKHREKNECRKFFWFDMFSAGDGGSEKTLQVDQSTSEITAINRSKLFDNVFVIKGDVLNTYVGNDFFSGRKIGFAHFDLNDYAVELSVIKKAIKCAESGTVFLFDDFAMAPFRKQNIKYRKFFRDIGLEMLELPTGQGVVIF